MSPAFTIAKREIFSYFVSPIAYVVTSVWLVWCGLQYYILAGLFAGAPNISASSNPLSAFFGGSVLFFIPLLVFAQFPRPAGRHLRRQGRPTGQGILFDTVT